MVKSKSISSILRKAVSLKLDQDIKKLKNQYSCIDKADGERYLLYIYNRRIYMILPNKNIVKYSGVELKDDKYDNTILDGEGIYVPKFNRFLWMGFDVLYIGNDDKRKFNLDRIKILHNIVKEISKFSYDFRYQKVTNTKDIQKTYIKVLRNTAIIYQNISKNHLIMNGYLL